MHTASLSLLLVSNLAYVFSTVPATAQPSTTTLGAQRDHARVLLVFAPSSTDPRLQQQLTTIASQNAATAERDLLVIPILAQGTSPIGMETANIGHLSTSDQTAARHRFHIAPQDFTIVLLGKDGEEKLRSASPVSFQQLRDLIDSMPMRQQEMREQKPSR